jgi:DNA polymerase I-like protein with 3'-5' exonuclease and polymerase domains
VVRRSGRKEQVYDILNCGPRQRFAVYNSKGEEAIAHNCVQATARDIFADHLLKLRDLGGYYVPVLIVHDEVLLEVPIDEAEEAGRVLQSVMQTAPLWCDGLPITADVQQLTQYTK